MSELPGGLNITFRFETPDAAKAAWEIVSRRCGGVSINRWAMTRSVSSGPQAITVLGEDDPRTRVEVEKARRILSRRGGEPIEPPAHNILAMRAKRRNMGIERGGRRTVTRTPLGTVIDTDGRSLGAFRRPQG